MSRVSAAIRPVPTLPSLAPRNLKQTVGIYLGTIGSAAFVALCVVAGSNIGPLLRLIIALVVAFTLSIVALLRPSLAVLGTLVYLFLLAFLRRLLISSVGWTSFDPMLVVGYVVATVLLIKLYFLDRRSMLPDLLSKLILALLAVTVIEVANPTGSGISSNIAGLLFMAMPLLWYFVGRALVDDGLSDRVLGLVVVLALVVGVYGLYQTQVGDPIWDTNWVNINGYTSLNVGSTVRAFGTFSSSAEYSLWVGSGLAVAFAFFLRGRAVFLLTLPLLAVSLFLASGRSALLLSFMAIVVMMGLRTHRAWLALAVVVCAVGGGYAGLKLFGSDLSGSSSSSLVSHQLNGITDPLNPNSSTLLVHATLVIKGFEEGITHPEGKGPGQTNQAAGVGNANAAGQSTNSQATEIDISNAFVALGVVGGFLYLGIVLFVLAKAVMTYFAGDEALLPVIGVLVVCAGEWMNGGEYALCPLIWLLIGSIALRSSKTAGLQRSPSSSVALAPSGPAPATSY